MQRTTATMREAGARDSVLTGAYRNEESGGAIGRLEDSRVTDFFRSNGTIEKIEIIESRVRPRVIIEKSTHTGHGVMKDEAYYYATAFDASLARKPLPAKEIAAILYVTEEHLDLISRRSDSTLGQLFSAGAMIEEQHGCTIDRERVLVPHGTASYLMRLRAR
jgi:hypothetical protein